MIPMFNKAAELCVPYFNAVLGGLIPNNTFIICLAFAILAPLGMFRGPFTLAWCGAATLGILKSVGFATPLLGRYKRLLKVKYTSRLDNLLYFKLCYLLYVWKIVYRFPLYKFVKRIIFAIKFTYNKFDNKIYKRDYYYD